MLKKQYLELLYFLSAKELKDKYKSSYIGMLWMLIIPFVTMATFYIIFKYFVPMNIPNYPIYLITGLIPWFFISFSVNQGVYVMHNNANLIKKVAFPKLLLPFSTTTINALNYFISLMILIFFIALSGHPLVFEKIILLPLLIVPMIVFCSCLSITLGYLYVFYRDLGPIAELTLFILFYATPIFWTLDVIPKHYKALIYFNPAVIFIELHHALFLDSSHFSLQKWGILYLWAFISFFLALITYRCKNSILADYVR